MFNPKSCCSQACFHAFLQAQWRASLAERTGHYYVDSKKLPVCDNLRIHSHRVFEGVASRGKGSTGWFFGLKLHLVTNEHGQLARFLLTPANNHHRVLGHLLEGLKGKCYGDKGYLSCLMQELLQEGLHLVTRIRKNMESMLLTLQDKLNLLKRGHRGRQ